MSNYLDKEISELRKEIADELGYTRKDKTAGRRGAFLALRPYGKILILGGVGLLMVIVLFALSSGGGNRQPPDNPSSASQPTLRQLEQRITRLEGIRENIELLERRGRELRQSLAEINRTESLLSQRVDQLSQVIDELQNRMASRSPNIEPPIIDQRKPTAPAEKRSHFEAPPTISRMPFSLPETRHHEVRPGDTLYSIAQRYSLTVAALCRLNNMTPRQVIHPGQELLVQPGGNQ